jgi:D-serine deaminase-like pyridoxal phosphate-dependent protein
MSLSIGPRTKGVRLDADVGVSDFVGRGLRVTDDVFSWPLLTLDNAALDHNIATAARAFASRGVLHAPHVKTHMSRALWERQEVAGAWGATVATQGQLRTLHTWGVRRVLLANELLDPRDAAWLRGALEGGAFDEVWVEVDSPGGVKGLARVFAGAAPDVVGRLGVLVELGTHGGRTGVRGPRAALDLARRVRFAGLRLLGVVGYEGLVARSTDRPGRAAVAGWCRTMRTLASDLVAEGLAGVGEPVVLSAGGSAFVDVVLEELTPPLAPGPSGAAAHVPRVVVRSGAYVAHDHGHYERSDPWSRIAGAAPLRPAMTVWAQVLSVPEAGLALLGAGRRDVSFDIDLPLPLWVRPQSDDGALGQPRDLVRTGARVTSLNDQHAYVRFDAAAAATTGVGLQPGDVVGLGISHPCTTFDKWRVAVVTRGDDVVDLYPLDF